MIFAAIYSKRANASSARHERVNQRAINSRLSASPDPYDKYLLSIAVGGSVDYLVTGDKSDLLTLKKY